MKRHDIMALVLLTIVGGLIFFQAIIIRGQPTTSAANATDITANAPSITSAPIEPVSTLVPQPTSTIEGVYLLPVISTPVITPGPPPLTPLAALDKPITTQEEAMKSFITHDKVLATWQTPWQTDGKIADRSRTTVEYFPDILAEESRHNRTTSYSENLVNDYGPVWTLAITGTVQLISEPDYTFGGIRYILSSRTGELVGYDAGPILNAKP